PRGRLVCQAAGDQFLAHPIQADLIQLVDRHQHRPRCYRRDAHDLHQTVEHAAVIEADQELLAAPETQALQHVRDRADHLGVRHRAGRADDIHVALVELAEASPGRPLGAIDRLYLVALVDARQVVAQPGVAQALLERLAVGCGQRAIQLLAALEHAEDQLVAFIAVLAQQGVQALQGRRLQRLEAVRLIDVFYHRDYIIASQYLQRQEVARAAERRGIGHRALAFLLSLPRLLTLILPG